MQTTKNILDIYDYEIPFKAINYMLQKVIYGGRITDKNDENTL